MYLVNHYISCMASFKRAYYLVDNVAFFCFSYNERATFFVRLITMMGNSCIEEHLYHLSQTNNYEFISREVFVRLYDWLNGVYIVLMKINISLRVTCVLTLLFSHCSPDWGTMGRICMTSVIVLSIVSSVSVVCIF